MENDAYKYSDCIWFNEKFDCKYIYRTAEGIMSGVTITMFVIVVYHLIMLMDFVKHSECIKALKPYLVSGMNDTSGTNLYSVETLTECRPASTLVSIFCLCPLLGIHHSLTKIR